MINGVKNFLLIAALLAAAFGAGYYAGGGLDKSDMTKEVCGILERKIVSYVDSYSFPTKDADSVTKLKDMNDAFAKNCKGRKIGAKPAEPAASNDVVPLPAKTCAAIEALLEEDIERRFDPRSQEAKDYFQKAQIYATLAADGCAENREKYKALAVREIDISRALDMSWINLDVVLIYKRLGLISEARAALDKAKKSGDYADDDLQLQEIERKLSE